MSQSALVIAFWKLGCSLHHSFYANFGQHPFVFDIEDYMREWRTKTQAQIDRFPIGDREGEWQTMIQK